MLRLPASGRSNATHDRTTWAASNRSERASPPRARSWIERRNWIACLHALAHARQLLKQLRPEVGRQRLRRPDQVEREIEAREPRP